MMTAISETAISGAANSRGRVPLVLYSAWLIGAVLLVGVMGGFMPILAPVAVALSAVGWICIARPVVAAYLLVSVVPVTSGIARGAVIPGLRISEVLTVLLGILVMLSADHRHDSRFRAVDYALMLYVLVNLGAAVGSRLANHTPLIPADFSVIGGPIQYLIYFRALALALRTKSEREMAVLVFLVASIPVSLIALAQAVVPAIDTTVKDITAYSTQQYGGPNRVTSLFPHFQVLSAYLFAIAVLATALMLYAPVRRGWRPALFVTMALAIAALAETVTMSSILATLTACTALVLFSRARWVNLTWLIAILLVAGLAAGPLLAERVNQQTTVIVGTAGADRNPLVPQTIAYRWDVWTNQSLPALRGHELFGRGPSLPTTQAWRSTESMYFTVLFRGGLVLLLAFVALLAVVVRTGWRAMRAPDPMDAAVGRALVLVAALLFPMCLIQPYLTYGGISHAVWLMAAIAATAPGVPAGSAVRSPLQRTRTLRGALAA